MFRRASRAPSALLKTCSPFHLERLSIMFAELNSSKLTVYEQAEQIVPSAFVDAALAETKSVPYWLDSDDNPTPEPTLNEDITTDLLVVGGGYTGLWTALRAKERDPDLDVVLVEGHECGWAASGRNGGFVSTSLTHGRANGQRHLPNEVNRLDALGRDNLKSIQQTIEQYDIDCNFEWNGTVTVAIEDRHVEDLKEQYWAHSEGTTFFNQQEIQAEIASPLYKAALWHHDESALVDPGRLVWGLKETCRRLGVRIYENSPVAKLRRVGAGGAARVVATVGSSSEIPSQRDGSADYPVVTAKKVALTTNVFRSLIPGTALYTVPV